MNIDIPGFGNIEFKHLVFDYNGTIARDGKLMSNLDRTIQELSEKITVHVITADTGGTAASELEGLPCILKIFTGEDITKEKEQYVISLGTENVVCIGNGANDSKMLKVARLGIAVLEGEGTALSAIQNADIIARSSYDAMGMLMVPLRIVATLRT
jgi:soluble P-type ATPase